MMTVSISVSSEVVNHHGVNPTAIIITFSQSTYTADEDSGTVQVELVLSNPSMTDITVQVDTIDITTNGIQ